jgi:hypothetical protein
MDEHSAPAWAKVAIMGIALIAFFSVASFALQYVYSNDLEIFVYSYKGIMVSGNFHETGDAIIPGYPQVERHVIKIVNYGNVEREASINVPYSGELESSEPEAEFSGGRLIFNVSVPAGGKYEATMTGKGLEIGEPELLMGIGLSGNATKSDMLYVDPGAPRRTQVDQKVFYYSNGVSGNGIDGFISEQGGKISMLSKSAIIIIAAIGLMIVVAAFGMFSNGERRRRDASPSRSRIHIERSQDFFSD